MGTIECLRELLIRVLELLRLAMCTVVVVARRGLLEKEGKGILRPERR